MDDLKLIFDELDLKNSVNYYILAGDLNAKHPDWQDVIPNNKGTSLRDWVRDNDLDYRLILAGPESPTIPSSGSHLVIVLRDAEVQIINGCEGKLRVMPFDSDHNAIQFNIKIEKTAARLK